MEGFPLSAEPLASMRNIGKCFGAVRVLQGVDFDIYPGEVHILAGENGAGKSTLIKILGGIYQPSEGTIEIGGKAASPSTPLEANDLGVSLIHQELSLIPSMSVMDNFKLGHYDTRWGFLSRKELERETAALLKDLDIEVNPRDAVEDASLSQQQLLEIGKATSVEAKIIVMDEPSSALSKTDTEVLFNLIDSLKEKGCGIVYITHRMEEIDRLADRITVLRDGCFVSAGPADEYDSRKLVAHMVGREIEDCYERSVAVTGDEILSLEDFSWNKSDGTRVFSHINLSLKKGEILGLGGLQGSGASELLSAMFGVYGNAPTGSIRLDGKLLTKRSPARSIREGIGLITNDRKATGLVLGMSVAQNASMAAFADFCSPMGWIRKEKETEAVQEQKKALSIKAADMNMEVRGLSGGNQQKVVLAKWIQTSPRVLLMDEPTRGVDIGAKMEIYRILEDLTSQGVSIILITSELPELLALSDRIAVMHRGTIISEFEKSEFDSQTIIAAAMGEAKADDQRSKINE